MRTKIFKLALTLLIAVGSIGTTGCRQTEIIAQANISNHDLVYGLFAPTNLDLSNYIPNVAYLMNNTDDMSKFVGHRNCIVPNIDFDKYTIVWGYVVAPHSGCKVYLVELSVNKGKYTMNIKIDESIPGYDNLTNLVFFGVYPKIETEVSLNIEYMR